MLLGLLVLALVAVGILAAYLLTRHHHHHAQATTVFVTTTPTTPTTTSSATARVAVPSVVGQSFATAEPKLKAAGLSVAKTQTQSSKPAGTILSEAPAPGTKTVKGSVITLGVSSGPATTTPTTTAATTTAATTTTATTTTATTTSAAPPQPTTATVPNVLSQTEANAVQSLNQAGILASIVFVPASDVLGTVESQAKPAQTTVPYHSHVQINLSRGPNNNPLEHVPNVIGQTLTQAVSTVNGAHLRLIYVKFPVTSKTQAGKIVQQSPLAGAQAPENAQVVVYLGAFKG